MRSLLVALARQPVEVQTAFSARNISDTVFADCLPEWRWASEYFANQGRYPALVALKARFPDFREEFGTETFDQLLQAASDQDTFAKMDALVQRLRRGVEQGQAMSRLASEFRDGAEALLVTDTLVDDTIVYSEDTGLLEDYKFRQQHRGGLGSIVDPFPWDRLNKQMLFVQRGEYMILEARPNFGKTWLTLGITKHLCERGERVLYNTIEMPKSTIRNRATAAFAELPYQDFRAGTLSPQLMRKWMHWRKNCQKNYQFFLTGVVGRMEQSLAVLQMRIRRFKPTVVIVDGAYKFANMTSTKSATHEMAAISQRLHQFALGENVFMIATIQMNRESENEDGLVKSQGLKSGYMSDAWGQDADIVIAVEGKKDSPFRTLNLVKAREAQGLKSPIHFQLSPRPFFGESNDDQELTDGAYASLDFNRKQT